MQRILMLLPSLVMGGADKFNLELAKILTAKGYQLTICTTLPSDNTWQPYFAAVVTDIVPLGDTLDPIPTVLDLIKTRQIEVVFISHSELGYTILPLIRHCYPDILYIDYCHLEEENWREGGHPRFSIGYQDWLDLHLVTSHYLRQWMIQRGGPAERIGVCTINIDTDIWQPTHFDRQTLRRDWVESSETCLILYAARLVPQKRPRLLVEIMQQLVAQTPQCRCLVVGDGPELPTLQEFVQTHQLTYHVQFVGAVPPTRMVELHAAADILLLPSAHEGISLAVYEAMAMETVPVVAAVGGQAELVTPACGYLIAPSPHEVAEYVSVLKQLATSPTLRLTLGQAARQRVATHFRLEQMGKNFINLLHQARQNRRTPPPLSATAAYELARQGRDYAVLARQIQQQNLTLQEFHQRIDTLWQENQRLFTANQEAWSAIHQLSAEKDHLWNELQHIGQLRDQLTAELAHERQHWLNRLMRKLGIKS